MEFTVRYFGLFISLAFSIRETANHTLKLLKLFKQESERAIFWIWSILMDFDFLNL